jgi:cold-inducible RNA-binding protein
MSKSKMFVGNLPFDTTDADLHTTFGMHGTVVDAVLMMDRESGRPRGFGFVTMSSEEESQSAINALHGHNVQGRALTVNLAKPRGERSDTGRGAGGGRREFSGHNRY